MNRKLAIKQYDVYMVNLDPTIGAEMKKIRPAVVVSNNDINSMVQTVVIVPLTSRMTNFPFRIDTNFNNKSGQLATDHIRSISKQRLLKKLGTLADDEIADLKFILAATFSIRKEDVD